LLGRFQGHGALFFRRNVETAELQSGGAFADAELRSALGNKVEHCDRLRSAGGVIVVGNHLANAVAEPDALGAGGGGGGRN
jgi:hypothetical protein